MMRVLKILKPAINGRIDIGYDSFDILAASPPSLDAKFILKFL